MKAEDDPDRKRVKVLFMLSDVSICPVLEFNTQAASFLECYVSCLTFLENLTAF